MVFLMAPRGALSRSLRKSHEGGRGIDRGVGPLVPRHTTRGASRRSSNDAGRRVSSVMSCVAHRGHRARHAPTLAEAARAVIPNDAHGAEDMAAGCHAGRGVRLEAHRALRSVVGWSHGTSTL